MTKPLIFCALDTSDLTQALHWARLIGPITGGLKLGMEFIGVYGPQGIAEIQKAAPDARLFIDLKFHDIPKTVASAVKAYGHSFHPMYLNVHTSGGRSMLQEAQAACPPQTHLLGVTLLTSLEEEDLDIIGYQPDVSVRVLHLARLAQQCNLAGVVCSGHEISALRRERGPDFVLMVPGIRPAGSDANDQKRTLTPQEAIAAGASHLVIGRPITGAADPAAAARAILQSL
ncbi:MAG: orotidine-5'-phosphate decarboxylase [Alphaproteobacteria bacterium]|nr:orotidine-5'-phosphate decarboxylase [Alphaproteobacteria bacterium]